MIFNFLHISIASSIIWIIGIIFLFAPGRSRSYFAGVSMTIIGAVLILIYIIDLWIFLGRPPLRTLGETRLWYSFFVPIVGAIISARWKMKWMLLFSIVLSEIFIVINLLHPENFNKSLMPALQSLWFIPHVIVYIFAYSIFASSVIISIKGLWMIKMNTFNENHMTVADNVVYTGFAFLTFGLLFGALWAKDAWGHYWTWDPKETWAFITWLFYLLYIHLRINKREKHKAALIILALSFLFLLICWFGVNYLPAAKNSVHTYSGS